MAEQESDSKFDSTSAPVQLQQNGVEGGVGSTLILTLSLGSEFDSDVI